VLSERSRRPKPTETTTKERTFLGGETTTCAREEANILDDDVCVSVMCRFSLSSKWFFTKSLGLNTLELLCPTQKRPPKSEKEGKSV